MLKIALRFFFDVLTTVAYVLYGAEGVNVLFYLMPAEIIVPTLRRYGATIGEHVWFQPPLFIHNASPKRGANYANLIVQGNCYIGRGTFLDLADQIVLEEFTTIAMRCTLITHTHLGDRPQELVLLPVSSGPIVIRRGAYLGANATVLEGVTIGQRAIVAAGAVVTKSIEDDVVVGGVPARALNKHQVQEQ